MLLEYFLPTEWLVAESKSEELLFSLRSSSERQFCSLLSLWEYNPSCPAHHQAASSLCSITPFSSHCDPVQRDSWDQKWSGGKGTQFWGFLGQALIWEVERPPLLTLRFNNFISHCQLGVILGSVPVLHCHQHYYSSCILGISLKKIKLCVLVDFT